MTTRLMILLVNNESHDVTIPEALGIEITTTSSELSERMFLVTDIIGAEMEFGMAAPVLYPDSSKWTNAGAWLFVEERALVIPRRWKSEKRDLDGI